MVATLFHDLVTPPQAQMPPLFFDPRSKHWPQRLISAWQDDLEAILLERVSLPNDQLKMLAAKNPPPQSWYDEAGDALASWYSPRRGGTA